MGKGRRAIPEEIKLLKGNPGKRKLHLMDGDYNAAVELPPTKIPDFLSDAQERAVFSACVDEYLHRRVARATDLGAFGRWAYYVTLWIKCKQYLAGKKSYVTKGTVFKRRPEFKDMIDIERLLLALEDRLGLNPTARQAIVRGLAAMPPALHGLTEEATGEEQKKPEQPAEKPSPLGFLNAAGKPH